MPDRYAFYQNVLFLSRGGGGVRTALYLRTSLHIEYIFCCMYYCIWIRTEVFQKIINHFQHDIHFGYHQFCSPTKQNALSVDRFRTIHGLFQHLGGGKNCAFGRKKTTTGVLPCHATISHKVMMAHFFRYIME